MAHVTPILASDLQIRDREDSVPWSKLKGSHQLSQLTYDQISGGKRLKMEQKNGAI